jgi:hypothetical protein
VPKKERARREPGYVERRGRPRKNRDAQQAKNDRIEASLRNKRLSEGRILHVEPIKKRGGGVRGDSLSSSFEDSSQSHEMGKFGADNNFEISLNEDLNLMVPIAAGKSGTVVSGGDGSVKNRKDSVKAATADRGVSNGNLEFGGRDSMGGDFGNKKNSLVSLDDEIL